MTLSFALRWATIRLPIPDLTVLWAGAGAANPYDVAEVTKAQRELRPIIGPLPFLYPPSALPLLFPFALLPFAIAFGLWTSLSVAAFWSAARKFTDHAMLALLTPHVIFSLSLGQTALFTGAAILWGVALLETQPLVAGALLGLGLALKPQVLFLAPLAMIARRHWKALATLVIAWAILALPLIALWPSWWATAQNLSADIIRYYPGVIAYAATPSYFARVIDAPILPFQIAGIVVGAVIVWLSFRSDDEATRVIGLVLGTLLAAPYALHYELVAATPVFMAAIMSNRARGALIAFPLICVDVLFTVPAMAISVMSAMWRSEGRVHADAVNRARGGA